ncbi:MAG: FMN-dependent NADH-azoreductase [Phenylobacterium sp.]|uniref:FMN-dependent NADH-azoreductase n=1 Tax=Phenylobacterium sp. TaxID=1871053 RepID=UPI0027367C92|nr:FMN-dependent NADH-azoreductase [Phenylobacterium sp.]MDP3749102.1 FMN-dependent NADH-azoreductase [Phenylobacterium sp.]
MSNILVLNSSLSGEASVSRLLVADAVTELTQRDPGATLVFRDLAVATIPHLTPESVAGVRAQATSPAELASRALSDELIAELRAADTIVIGAPMYNFSIPSTLRTWFDHVLRPGVTFSYSEAGPKGLIEGKRVIVVESRGGLYSEGPAQAADFQEPYLRQLLGFIGLTDVTFVRAEKIGYGPDARDQALADSRAELAKLAA